jgi:hypothetical protein
MRGKAARRMRLLLSVLAAMFFLAGGAYGYLRWRDAEPSANVEASVDAAHFSFPPAYARDAATKAGGPAYRLALAVQFPEFAPTGRAEKAPPRTTQLERAPETVLITITPKDDSLEPADRPAKLYARFLEGETEVGPGGLVLRRFETGSPYDLELLYVGPPDGRGFFARCPKGQDASAVAPDMCLSLFRDGSLDVELRFAPQLLPQWEALLDGARGFLGRIRNAAGERR